MKIRRSGSSACLQTEAGHEKNAFHRSFFVTGSKVTLCKVQTVNVPRCEVYFRVNGPRIDFSVSQWNKPSSSLQHVASNRRIPSLWHVFTEGVQGHSSTFELPGCPTQARGGGDGGG